MFWCITAERLCVSGGALQGVSGPWPCDSDTAHLRGVGVPDPGRGCIFCFLLGQMRISGSLPRPPAPFCGPGHRQCFLPQPGVMVWIHPCSRLLQETGLCWPVSPQALGWPQFLVHKMTKTPGMQVTLLQFQPVLNL